MAGRGPRTGDGRRTAQEARAARGAYEARSAHAPRGGRPHAPDGTEATGAAGAASGTGAAGEPGVPFGTSGAGTAPWTGAVDDVSLVRICDLAGRPRGLGFAADRLGTVVTGHETVDGLARLVLHAGDRTRVISADEVTALPGAGLALIRARGLGLVPLPVTVRARVDAGAHVRIAAGGWRAARVLGTGPATYTATDRFHTLDAVLELAVGTAGSDALRLGGGAAGGPVVDAATGAVVAVLGTALRADHPAAGRAVLLRAAAAPGGPLAALLARNAATVPAYGDDLNLAAVMELTHASRAADGPRGARAVGAVPGRTADGGAYTPAEPVERAAVVREFAAFAAGSAVVLGLVGAPGSGRTTELAALAERRARAPEPAPVLWLRGADLRGDDLCVADAARRALERAGRIVSAAPDGRNAADTGGAPRAAYAVDGRGDAVPEPFSADLLPPAGYDGALGDLGPDGPARVAHAAGRPLLLLLDDPEEMPSALARRLHGWTAATADWLRACGARLVVACRPEFWEQAGAGFPPETLHEPVTDGARPPAGTRPPACVRLGDLEADEARAARARHGVPEGVLGGADARHPLTLRLLAEVRAAAPDAADGRPDRDEVLSAHLDLACLRVAERLAAAHGLRGTAVRRLAARVAGRVHEAARRCLGPGQGRLDHAAFDEVFPWGSVRGRRFGGVGGWAPAVLAEGLLVPSGGGYRFAHEELADWLQGVHLDLDEALSALVHRRRDRPAARTAPVPRHRIGPVVQALLYLGRQRGSAELARRLEELLHTLDRMDRPDAPAGPGRGEARDRPDRAADDPAWWAARLLADVLSAVPDATPYVPLLRLLARAVVDWRRLGRAVPEEFGPAFWDALPVSRTERLDLLRRLVVADGAPGDGRPRHLDAVSRLLSAAPAAVQPLLTRWFDDERPLPGAPGVTVAAAAQVLLHTHRRQAPDDLTEALVACAHPRGDALLTVLCEEEPAAVCRAVDRWAQDERPARRAAAVTYALRAAPHLRTDADRELLRYAALALLARPGDDALHGGALALLVRDGRTRARYLPRALERFTAGDPHLPASALAVALTTDPEPVLAAFRIRLRGPDAGEVLRTLADVTTPALVPRVAALVRDAVEPGPATAAHVATYVDRRLERGPAARAVLLPLVTHLLDDGSVPVRTALAGVLATPGTDVSRSLRRELLDLLLAREDDPAVLEEVLRAAADGGAGHGEERTRALVHRAGSLLARTPDGAVRCDRVLVGLGHRVPGFAGRLVRWLDEAPGEWSPVAGPGTRRALESLAGAGVPA